MSAPAPSTGPAAHGTHRSDPASRRSDRRGGAVALMVILLTPMLALAAITAAAVPRRLAAQAAVDDTATQLASMAADWRGAQARPHDPVDWFFPDCTTRRPSSHTASEEPDAGPENANGVSKEPDDPQEAPDNPPSTGPDANAEPEPLREACIAATQSLLASLGARGVDADRLAGYYTSAYSTIAASSANPDHLPSVPCRISAEIVAVDAVHLGIVADWGTGGWASAQTWPNGITLHSQAAAHRTRPAQASDPHTLPDCVPLGSPATAAFAERTPTRTAFGNPATQ